MPNWTTNTLRFAGTPEQMAPIIDATTFASGAQKASFSFEKILPIPQELVATRSPVKIDPEQNAPTLTQTFVGVTEVVSINPEENRRRIRLYGANNWYNWSVRNWGTKWDAVRTEVLSHTPGSADSPTILVLRFDTAWTAPHRLIGHLRSLGVEIIGGAIYEGGDEFEDLSENPEDFEEHFVVRSEVETEDEYAWRMIEMREAD